MRYFVATIFAIIGLALPFELEAQNKELMRGYEKDLNSLFEQVFSTENKENERYNANEEVMVIMEEALLQRDSYKWKWKLRKGVSVLTSDDDKFRVITWAVVNDNNEFECFGYMQVLNENADVYEVCRLQDKTADIFNPGEVALTDQNWFGCIYTDLITTKYDGRYYGMDRDNNYDRLIKAYDVIVNEIGPKKDNIKEFIEESYKEGTTDEFLIPTMFTTGGNVSENDGLIALAAYTISVSDIFKKSCSL